MNRKVLAAGLLVILPLVGVLLANIKRDPHIIQSPLIGKPAPAFRLDKLSGGAPLGLQDFAGKPVVINFWATWCLPCMQEQPTLSAYADRLRDQVQFLGVVYDDQEDRVRSFLEANGSPYPNLLDPEGKTAVAYGVQGVPETYFVDPKGVIVSKIAWPLDGPGLELELDKIRGGAP